MEILKTTLKIIAGLAVVLIASFLTPIIAVRVFSWFMEPIDAVNLLAHFNDPLVYLTGIAFLVMVVGVIFPKRFVWCSSRKTRWRAFFIYGGLTLYLFLMASLWVVLFDTFHIETFS